MGLNSLGDLDTSGFGNTSGGPVVGGTGSVGWPNGGTGGWELVGGAVGGQGTYDTVVALPDYIDSTGKTVSGGLLLLSASTPSGGGADFSVTRLRSDGSADATFGAGGMTTVNFSYADQAQAAVLSDGRIVVAGTSWPWIYSGAEDVSLVRLSGDWSAKTRTYVRQDANFNVTSTITLDGAVRDAGGAISPQVERYEYTPYGVVTVMNADFTTKGGGGGGTWSASGIRWKQGFQGYTADAALGGSGIYYARERLYDPQQGRFTSQDPLGYPDGASRYAMEGGNPVGRVDPDGMLYGYNRSPWASADQQGSFLGPGGSSSGSWSWNQNLVYEFGTSRGGVTNLAGATTQPSTKLPSTRRSSIPVYPDRPIPLPEVERAKTLKKLLQQFSGDPNSSQYQSMLKEYQQLAPYLADYNQLYHDWLQRLAEYQNFWMDAALKHLNQLDALRDAGMADPEAEELWWSILINILSGQDINGRDF
jgi:RHS repeat-associated protein